MNTTNRVIITLTILLSIMSLLILGPTVYKYLTRHERQVAFLQNNQEKIIKAAFEGDKESEADNIKLYWDSVKVEENGFLIAKPYALSVRVSYMSKIDNEIHYDTIIIETDTERLDRIDEVSFK